MYNHIHIEKFIEKVNKEANEAAQQVFDKYQPQLEQMILNQMQPKDKFYIGMGSATFKSDKGEKLADTLAQTQYQVLDANFTLPDLAKE